ncbi:insulinase family protein [Massilia sp. LjRoot122]|uniref:insulinase family protein n=1 Tax=Massilia sp. LjRoot122 TaxID=3342257 RepID=UPI003ECFE549
MSPFELLRTHSIPSLQANLEEYRDSSTGARHVHLATDQNDMAFLVAFPTVPENSDGRAHILEHLALSGSERYPVRNPFFSMMRRSTASFMNAMTYADRTVYPFASTDSSDFFNLLDVYLDATFFPKLDYLTFLQEGWRHSLDGDKLTYQGVVFNEMKGAFADPGRALYQGILTGLLQGTTYEVVSGGDPLAIPDLSHTELKKFHAEHYHPSQAVFMTAGPIPATEIQQRIGERVLSRLTGIAPLKTPQLASVESPRQASVKVPAQAGRDDGYGVQFAWIIGESGHSADYHQAGLLQAGLLGDASAPVRKAMESAGYGRPSRINGMDPNPRQLMFHLGMEGLKQHQVADAQIRIWEALEQAAKRGVPEAVLRAALRDTRYRQRDTSSNRMPNVLARMLEAVPVAMRGGDVQSAFDSERALVELDRQIAEPDFFKNMVRALIDSPARLTATIVPDPEYFAKRELAETERLARAAASLNDEERRRIDAENAALLEQQRQQTDTSLLPRIRPCDVSTEPRLLPDVAAGLGYKQAISIASNGISYARVQYDVSSLPEHDWPWLQLYVDLRRDLGVANRSYDEADAWRKQRTPAFSLHLAPALSDGSLKLALSFQASGLREEHTGITEVLDAYIGSPRFDEFPRIAFLCTQTGQQRLKNLAQAGDQYAGLMAAASGSELRYFENATAGIGYLPFVARIQRQVATDDGIAQVARQLERIHAFVTACPVSVICAGSGDDAERLAELINVPGSTISREMGSDVAPSRVLCTGQQGKEYALHAPSQVNHCNIAWPVPDESHADAGALAVAAELLTQRFLHTAIREKGGAYGGAAGYAYSAGIFTMRSYRDPRLAGTYADFSSAVEALLETELSTEQVEEAIISVIKGLDRPLSPFDAVLAAVNLQRRGIDPVDRSRFRKAVLTCTEADVKAAVDKWLSRNPGHRAAFVGNVNQDLAGLDVVELLPLFDAEKAAA